MKGTKILATALVVSVISGCASVNPFSNSQSTVKQPEDNLTAIKDQTVALAGDEGIKIYYTLLGDLERIEVYGVADAWKGNVEIRAEADAKERLVKYLYEEKVNSRRNIEVIARTLDKARDDALNKIENDMPVASIVEFKQDSIESEIAQSPAPNNSNDNTSRRVAERIEETKVTAITSIVASGSLRGMRKIGERLSNDGKKYIAIYEWSTKGQATANEIRRKMFAN